MKLNRTKIKSTMVEKELRQYELAAVAGVSKATLSSIMNGKTASFVTASKIAKALELDVMELIETEV